MSEISEKVAYIHGLLDGIGVEDEKYNKLYSSIVEVLGEMAKQLDEHEEAIDDIEDDVDDLYECIDDYDDFLFGDDDDDDEDEDDDEDDEDEGFIELECPKCGKTVFFGEEMLINAPESFKCPNCGEQLEPVFVMEDGEVDDGDEDGED